VDGRTMLFVQSESRSRSPGWRTSNDRGRTSAEWGRRSRTYATKFIRPAPVCTDAPILDCREIAESLSEKARCPWRGAGVSTSEMTQDDFPDEQVGGAKRVCSAPA
jgi:hypothetical protein